MSVNFFIFAGNSNFILYAPAIHRCVISTLQNQTSHLFTDIIFSRFILRNNTNKRNFCPYEDSFLITSLIEIIIMMIV